MKKIIFFSCIIFSAALMGGKKEQVDLKALFESTNKTLQSLANLTFNNGLAKLGRALHYAGESMHDQKFIIENKNSLKILSLLSVVEDNKVKKDIRDAFNMHGKRQIAALRALVSYKIFCDNHCDD